MTEIFDILRARVNGSLLQNHVGKNVCLLGEIVQVDPNGRSFKVKASDGIVINIHSAEPDVLYCYSNMKYIKIYPDDAELFKFQIDSGLLSDGLLTHLPEFRRMYVDQGDVFWVRYLFSMREFIFNYVFYDFVEQFLSDHKSCFYYCLIAIENISIQIHKRFIEGKYKHAVQMIIDIYNLDQFTVKNDKYSSLYYQNLCLEIQSLLGSVKNVIDAGKMVTALTLMFYNGFYGSLCVLLERFLNASDLPYDFNDNYPRKQYWIPGKYWSRDVPQVNKFSTYVAKYWDNKLPKILLTPDVHNIFLNMPRHQHFCSLDGEFDMENFCHSLRISSRHRQCEIHESCRNKILHDRHCKEPYLCVDGISCKVICEVQSEERQVKLMNDHSNFWKTFEAESFPCDRSTYRDASTTAETYDNLIETYVLGDAGNYERPPSPPWYLSAEDRNSYNQFRKKHETVSKLRYKLEKKQSTMPSFMSNFNVFDKLNTSIYRDCHYRVVLYKKALNRLASENVNNVIEKKLFIAQLSELKFLKCYRFSDESDDISAACTFPGRRSTSTYHDDNFIYNIILPRKLSKKSIITSKSCHQKHDTRTDELELTDSFFKLYNNWKENDMKRMAPERSKQIYISHSFVHGVAQAYTEESNRRKNQKKLYKRARSQDAPCAKDNSRVPEKVSKDDLNESENVSVLTESHKSKFTSDANDDLKSLKAPCEDISNQFYAILPAECNTVSEKLDAIEKGDMGYKASTMQAGNQLDAISSQKVNAGDPKKRHMKQRQCAFCNKVEGLKKFKKCAQCKTENYPVPRYYCSKECQIEDWKEFHRDEHQRNLEKL